MNATMRKLHAVVFFVALADSANAQQLHINMTKFFGGGGQTLIADIMYDARDKSVVFCGAADSLGTGDLIPKPAHLTSARFSQHLFVGNMESNKNLLWVKTHGGATTVGEGAEKCFADIRGLSADSQKVNFSKRNPGLATKVHLI